MSEDLELTVDKFTFRVAAGRFYSPEGVWAMPQPEGRVRVGIGDFLQQRSGDAAFLSVKPAGTRLEAGDELGALETVKVTLSLHSPVAGTVVEVNRALDLRPEVVNADPYGEGWLAVIEPASWEADRDRLLDAPGYRSVVRTQVEQELGNP